MGAGILPVTILKGSIIFLLGREQNSNYWCDFGGSSNNGESIFDTAIREGYKELVSPIRFKYFKYLTFNT